MRFILPVLLAACSSSGLAPDLDLANRDGQAIVGDQAEWSSYRVAEVHNLATGRTCGGTWVGDQWLLTAAHCVGDASAMLIDEGRQEVVSVVVHPDADAAGRHDLALVEVAWGVWHDRAVILDGSERASVSLYEGLPLSVVGHGAQSLDEENGSSYTYEASVSVLDLAECDLYPVSEDSLCTTSAVCAGDDGGPVLASWENMRPLVAVISRGLRCGETGAPAVHTALAPHVDWLAAHVPDLLLMSDDHGNDQASATLVDGDRLLEVSGWIHPGDIDVFEFYLETEKDFELVTVSDEPLAFEILDYWGDPIQETMLEASWYNVRVSGWWGNEDTAYLIEIPGDDHGDDWDHATPFDGYEPSWIDGRDVDVFLLEPDGPMTLGGWSDVDIDVRLFDLDGNRIFEVYSLYYGIPLDGAAPVILEIESNGDAGQYSVFWNEF